MWVTNKYLHSNRALLLDSYHMFIRMCMSVHHTVLRVDTFLAQNIPRSPIHIQMHTHTDEASKTSDPKYAVFYYYEIRDQRLCNIGSRYAHATIWRRNEIIRNPNPHYHMDTHLIFVLNVETTRVHGTGRFLLHDHV
jgi:hypothetical protein